MLKIGIIRTGMVAREHAAAIAMAPDCVRLTAASDIDPKRLREFCETFGAPNGHASADDLIRDPDVDLVAVATPPAAHEKAVIAALEAGKYVLCEKPLAHSLAS